MAFLEWLIHATHLHAVINTASRDIYVILLLRFLRMYAYGGCALVLGIFLYISGNTGTQIGTFLTLVLCGDAGISYLLTIKADKIGRRRVLMIGSIFMMAAGVVFALTTNYYILLIAAILGVISPGAHEIGP
jgi:MFS family permease